MTQIVLTLFGAFAVTVPTTVSRHPVFATDKVRGLLAYLALQPAQPHRREQLAALFWPEIRQTSALTNLRQTFHRLRDALEHVSPGSSAALFLVTRQTLQFVPVLASVDVRRFTALLTESEAHPHTTLATCDVCLARLTDAAALYRGELLAGFGLADAPTFEEWLLLQREFYQQQALLVLQKLTTAYATRGDYDQAHTYASRQLALDPYREDAHRQVMRLLAQRGLPSQALAQYERCRTLLRTELGVAPDVETLHLAEQIRAGSFEGVRGSQGDKVTAHPPVVRSVVPPSPPHLVTLSSPRPNLPAQLTPLVGRAEAVSELCQRLQEPSVRLLTIVGAGGMGKTRLALAVGQQILDFGVWILDASDQPETPSNLKSKLQNLKFPDGVFFVSLAALTTVDAVAPAISAALGVNLPGEPQQALCQALRTKRLLLILDNLEHLLDVAALVVTLLEAAPGLVILATSRERLNLRGEHLYRIPPLDYEQAATADQTRADDLAAAQALAAVQLFIQSAQRLQADFQVDAANVMAVLHICRLVQGMPLGLELAAAWVGTLSLAEIAEAITQSADLLTSDWRDLPARQRSLRAVFDWSWRLLTPVEQQALGRLAVFSGGFTRAAAQSVTGAPLPLLTRLVHKSLLQWQEATDATSGGRYSWHEVLRQFVAAQVAHLPADQTTIQRAHGHFYLTYLAERTPRLVRRDLPAAGAELHGELDNIRQAWQWAAAHVDIALLDGAAYGWWQFCAWRGLIQELRQSMAVAVQGVRAWLTQPERLEHAPALNAGRRLLSKLLAIQANLRFAQGQDEEMAAEAEEAIALGQATGGIEGEAFGCFVLGRAYQEFEKTTDAITQWQKAIALAHVEQQRTTPSLMVCDTEWMAHLWLRGAAMAQADYTGARVHMQQALQICQQIGNQRGELNCLTNLAWNDMMAGDYAAAQQCFAAGYALALTLGHRWAEMATGIGLGEVGRLQGDYMAAVGWWQRSLTLAVAYSPYDEAMLLALLVRLHSYLGDQVGATAWRSRLFALLAGSKLPKDCQRQALLSAAVQAYYGGEMAAALDYAEQVHQLTGPGDIMTERAAMFVILGHAQSGVGQWTAARTSYQEALDAYTTVGNRAAATEAQAGLAQVALAQGNHETARQWVEAILPVLAVQPRAGFHSPFSTYLTCYQVLVANQDSRASTMLEQGWRLLLDYAVAITEPALRRCFLEGVAVHRTLQALHEAGG